MSDIINLTDVESNQILIWSDIEQAFINVTPNGSVLNIDEVTHQPLSPNANVISNVDSSIIRTRGIVGGDNVTITQTGTDIIIDVNVDLNSDAETLSGFTHFQFVKKSELNDLIDLNFINDNLDVYSKSESHDQFMETNASNIPDADNVYDLGSNGRRYADIYAKTFHGTATNAMYAGTLLRNGANDDDVLSWKDGSWVPTPMGGIPLTNLSDVVIDDAQNNNIIAYDEVTEQWHNISANELIATQDLEFSNSGQGEEVFINVIDNNVRFRTFEANTGVLLSSDENSVHISLDDDHIESMIYGVLETVTVDSLETIFNLDVDNENTMLVWEDGKIINKPIPVGGGDGSIDTSNAEVGQVLSFDGTNLVFVHPYNPFDDIDTTTAQNGYYLAYTDTGYELRQLPVDSDTLSEIDTSMASNGDVVVWDGTGYTLDTIIGLDSIDVDGVVDGYVITFEDGEFVLREPESVGLTLDDLDTSTADDGYYVAYTGTTFELREMVDTGTDNDTLGDVDTSTANEGDVLTWDGSDYVLSPSSDSDTLLELETIDAVDGYYVAYNGVGYELRELPTGGDTNTDMLADVDTSAANDGDLLVWDGSTYTLRNVSTLDNLDLSSVENGYVVTYQDGAFVLTENSVVEDTLSQVDTTNSNPGDFLIWDGTQYTLSTVDLTDNDTLGELDTSSALNGYYVSYTGNGYELRELPSGSGDTNTDMLADVDTSSANSGDVLVWDGSNYVLQNISTLDDLNLSGVENGYVITYQDGGFVLSEQSVIEDTLSSIDTTSAASGDVLTWDGSAYTLTTANLTDNDTLGDVDTSSALDGYYVAYNGTSYELRELPTDSSGEPNTDLLAEVDTSLANNGDVLVWNGAEYTLSNINTLDDIDTSLAGDGYVMTYQNGEFVLSEMTISDTLAEVDTSSASSGDVLVWDGNAYTLSALNNTDNDTLGDVSTVGADDGYYVAYNGTSYELRELPAGSGDTNTDLLADIDTSTANDGDVLTWNGSEYTLSNITTLGDIDTSLASNGYVLTYQDGEFVLSEMSSSDTLAEVDTSSANNGDVLIWDGNVYTLSTLNITDNDTLGDVSTVGADDGYYVAYNGADYELRELPTSTGDTNTDLLADVDTTSATNGDVLIWNGSEYVLTTTTTLDDVDVSSAANGQVLTYQDGDFVLSTSSDNDTLSDIDVSSANDGDYVAYNTTSSEYELRSVPVNTDLLADVDSSLANPGDVLTWDGTDYTLSAIDTPSISLNDLTDVSIVDAQENQVLAWDGANFTLQTFTGSGGATSLSELSDVDETVVPNDGDVLTYNTAKSQYEPLPFNTSSGGGTKYEILRVNYNASSQYGSVEYITDNIEVVSVIDSDLVLLEVKFTNYTFPPLSVGYWGFVYVENMYRFINITEGVSQMSISNVGTSAAPTLFDPNRGGKEYNMVVSARTNETQSTASSGFPPEPTHAYVVFVMGD